jgi:hypothetical protein
MFSRIETTEPRGVRSTERSRSRKAFVRRGCLTAVAAALLTASGCGPREDLIAKITFDSGAPEVAECVPTVFVSPDMGLDLYFVIDHSSTVDDEWGALSFGLAEVFNMGVSHPGDEQPAEFAGIGVGFGLYPTMLIAQSCADACPPALNCNCLDECGCRTARPDFSGVCQCYEWPTSCVDDDYKPTYEIVRLRDGQHARGLTGLPRPNGSPALRPALVASLRAREEWESTRMRRRITQVLIGASSLEDRECANDNSDIEKVLSGPDKPKTYVVAVNRSSDMGYDRLAVAGRTEFVTRIPIDTGRPPFPPPPSPATRLAELVRYIREAEGRCEYLVPNGTLDYDQLNLTAKSGGALFLRVADSSDCARNPQGWYYEPNLPNRPTRMIACEGACKTLHGPTGRENATALIQRGCPTKLDAGP